MREMTVSEVKQCALNILFSFDLFCKQNGLRYWLCGGTLLGAVRHKGFIPWDDDIDIMMPRSEYDRLLKVFPDNGRFRLVTHRNLNNCPFSYAKIIDTQTVKKEKIRKKFQNIGVEIDVFPIDSFPNDIKESLTWCNEIKRFSIKANKQIITYYVFRNPIKTVAFSAVVSFWHLLGDMGITPLRKYILKMDQLAQKYNGTNSQFCGISCIAHYGINERNDKAIYESSVDVEFEGKMYPAPVGYKIYLSNLYGDDYMKLPPEDKRKSHHNFKAYWK